MAVVEVSVNTYGFATFIHLGRNVDRLIGYHNADDRKAWQMTPLGTRHRFPTFPTTTSSGPK